MAKRIRLTEMEAYNVKGKKSEPIGSRGKGPLTLERKTAGFITGYYRERTNAGDKRVPLGTLTKKPRTGTNEMDLDSMRLAALRTATAAIEAGGLAHSTWSSRKSTQRPHRRNWPNTPRRKQDAAVLATCWTATSPTWSTKAK